jgi:predicted kinase
VSGTERVEIAAALARVLLAEDHQPLLMTPGDVRHLLVRYQRLLTELVDALRPQVEVTGLEDPKPESRTHLRARLGKLPRGHPSSPYNEDGSLKPPVTDLSRIELPEPDGEQCHSGLAVVGGRLYDVADACDSKEPAVGIDDPESTDVVESLDDLKRGSNVDLKARLDALPHGHPSSPYNEDGSVRPPVTRLRDFELPEPGERNRPGADKPHPLTDVEHAEHVSDVRTHLDKARRDGLATDRQFTTDEDQEQWTADRDRMQGELVSDLYKSAHDVPCDHRAILAGGLTGAGKTTILDQIAGIDRSQYLTINPDTIKEEMARRGMVPEVEDLSPMEASDLVHEESSHVAKQLSWRALSEGKNLIWDITMASRTSTEQRIDDLRSAGYTDIEGIFVDIPVEVSAARADARHRRGHDEFLAGKGTGGRFIPAEVIERQADPEWRSGNRRTFEAIKSKIDRWSLYDNSTEGRVPVVVDAGQREEKAP